MANVWHLTDLSLSLAANKTISPLKAFQRPLRDANPTHYSAVVRTWAWQASCGIRGSSANSRQNI